MYSQLIVLLRESSLIILSAYRPMECKGTCSLAWLPLFVYELMLVWRSLLTGYVSHWISTIQLILQLGLCYLFSDQCRMMREMKYCLLVWAFATCFQTSQDNGGDGMLSPCLGLCYLLSDLAG